ncbi:MAG: hypothetical protein AAGJ93_11280 [Bacteroidota bacterium]
MKYQWLLFDFDNTLVDFTNTAKSALRQTFVDFNAVSTPEIEAVYKTINTNVWAAFSPAFI